MPLITAAMVWNAPLRLASSTASQSSSSERSRMLSRVRPALLTRMSIGPRAPLRRRHGGLDLRLRPRRRRHDPGAPGRRAGGDRGRARRLARPTIATSRPRPWSAPRDRAPIPARAAGDERDLSGRESIVMVMRGTLHLAGRAEASVLADRDDPLEQAREHRAGARSRRTRAGASRGRSHAFHPAHRRR